MQAADSRKATIHSHSGLFGILALPAPRIKTRHTGQPFKFGIEMRLTVIVGVVAMETLSEEFTQLPDHRRANGSFSNSKAIAETDRDCQ